MGCFVWGGKNGMGCYVRGDKNSMGCYVQGDKNSMGCFVRGGKSLWDVLSGVAKNGMGCFCPGMFCPAPIQTCYLLLFANTTPKFQTAKKQTSEKPCPTFCILMNSFSYFDRINLEWSLYKPRCNRLCIFSKLTCTSDPGECLSPSM